MKKLFLCYLAGGLLVNFSFAQGKKTQDKRTSEPAKFELKNGVDSFSYAAGVNIGQNMKDQGITELNIEAMSKALEEIIQGKPTLLNKEQANMTLQQKLQEFSKKKGDAEKAKCQNYYYFSKQ
jgi:FKBP-type peptidyl-prolyl cis-trans isomerase FklB